MRSIRSDGETQGEEMIKSQILNFDGVKRVYTWVLPIIPPAPVRAVPCVLRNPGVVNLGGED